MSKRTTNDNYIVVLHELPRYTLLNPDCHSTAKAVQVMQLQKDILWIFNLLVFTSSNNN